MLRLSPRLFVVVIASGAALTAASSMVLWIGQDARVAALIASLGLSAFMVGIAGTMWARRLRAVYCREWVMSAVRSLSDAVIVTDANGTVTAMNGPAESMTGWAQCDAVGQPILAVFRLVDVRTHRPVVNPVVSALYNKRIVGPSPETVLVGKDGTERQVEETAAPIFDDGGRVFAGAVAFKRVSDGDYPPVQLRNGRRITHRAAEWTLSGAR